MRIQLSASRKEDGAVAVTVAMMSVLLLVIVAFTTDFGMAYAQREAMATGADSAALAVVRAKYTVAVAANPAQTCDTLRTNDAGLAVNNPAKASNIALAQVNANGPFGATLLPSDVITTLTCISGGQVLEAKVVVNRAQNPIFGSVVDGKPLQISRQAVAALGVVNGVSGLMPMAICTDQANAIIDKHRADVAAGNPESAQLVSLDKVWGGTACGDSSGSGNWGWLDFGAGVSAPNLVSYINGSYPAPVFTLDPSKQPPSYTMNGTPGSKSSVQVANAMGAIMDKIVTLAVYSTVGGGGSGTTYKVIGFVSVKLCGYDNKRFGVCYDSSPSVKMSGNDMQVRYVDYTPVGELGTACGIGQACAFNAYVTKLLG